MIIRLAIVQLGKAWRNERIRDVARPPRFQNLGGLFERTQDLFISISGHPYVGRGC